MTKLYEAQNYILIHTDYADPEAHRHMAAHIILGLEDIVTVNSHNDMYQGKGIMIPVGVSHAVDTKGKPVLVFLYDSTTEVAKQISQLQTIDNDVCDKIASLYQKFVNGSNEYHAFEQELLVLLELPKI